MVNSGDPSDVLTKNKHYIGWVPTVLGNLSFKLVGHSGYPFDFYSITKEDEIKKTLTIICLQRRIPHDYAIPIPFVSERRKLLSHAWLGSKFKKENIESCFLLSGRGCVDANTRTVQKIEGTVYRVFHKDREEQKVLYEKLREKIIVINGKINAGCSDDDCENLISELNENAKKFCLVRSSITLDRQGICEIKSLELNEDEKEMLLSEEQYKSLVNQFFYFIKDAFHSHKHHHYTEDTLISAYPVIDSDGVLWFDNIIKNIYRNFIRRRDEFTKVSLGVFCYINTFTKIAENWQNSFNDTDSEDGSQSECKNSTLLKRTVSLEELKNSIKVCIDKNEDRQKYTIWAIAFILAIITIFVKPFDEYVKCFYQNHKEIVFIMFITTLYVVTTFVKSINPFEPSCVNINLFKTESRSFVQCLNLAVALTKSKECLLFYISVMAILIASYGVYLIIGFDINIFYFIVSACVVFIMPSLLL
ncbi:hypothetical protein B0F88_12825 [Methylobacter tundripaludum]|uniref:Uncharacterized protein n=1 Tax=Methylobacter tundripaludum TaxID=173365 RepID=A0A2S6GFZ4_9GAMM|nr:hypothetical protein [Methylobacter tundripaludum]PPK64134.1 hypothetical protein B0F88_12825 [Methylobacter tundripaludum]